MSTYLYLECKSHTPPLLSEDEVGQHLSDLPRIQREIAKLDAFTAIADEHPEYDGYFTRHAARFLSLHPGCVIGIRDEYGDEYPVAEEEK